MKTLSIKSTKKGKFTIELPDDYSKIKLPYFKKWVKALESGKYRQTTGSLCSLLNKKLNYCCLGVLTKIQGCLKKGDDNVYRDSGESSFYLSSSNSCHDVLSMNGELPDKVFIKNEYGYSNYLTQCNDVLKLSFKDIAKIIKTLYKA